jgi:MFS family permease
MMARREVQATAESNPAGSRSVVGAFISHFLAFGTSATAGVFLIPMSASLRSGQAEIALAFGLGTAVLLSSSHAATLLAERLGTRQVVAIGTVAISTSLLLVSMATAAWQVILVYGIPFGLGASCVFAPTQGEVLNQVQKNYGRAIGIVVAGSGAGQLCMVPLTSVLVGDVGWRDSARIVSVIDLAVGAVACICLRGARRRVVSDNGPRIKALQNRGFRLLYLGCAFGAYGFTVPTVFLIAYAERKGIDPRDAAKLFAIMAVGSVVGRLASPMLADRFGQSKVLRIGVANMAIVSLLWPVLHLTDELAAFALLFGLGMGTWMALPPTILRGLLNSRQVSRALGTLYTGQCLGCLIAPPITGLLFDRERTYTLGILLGASTLVANFGFFRGIGETGGSGRTLASGSGR